MNFGTYRDIIQEHYKQKRRKNPAYSLRSFARDVEISPSQLSEVLSGKTQLSVNKANILAKKLNFNESLRSHFVDLVQVESARSQAVREEALARINSRLNSQSEFELSHDDFEGVAYWQMIAVWSFLSLPAYDGTLESVATGLGLDELEVYNAIRRLNGANLIKMQDRRWVQAVKEFAAGGEIPSKVVREFHAALGKLGHKSIEDQTFEERHLESAVVNFAPERLHEVSEKISQFTQQLIDEFSSGDDVSEIYSLSLQFFRLSKKTSNRAARAML